MRVAWVAALLVLLGSRAQAASCDRACLNGVLDGYMTALAEHDPSKLATTASVRFSENSEPLKLGDGLWGTFTKAGAYRHSFMDEAAGQAGLFAVIEENGIPALFVLRIKVEDRKIAEIETIVVRKADMPFFLKTDATEVKPVWFEKLAPAERSSRADMVRIANLYFDGLEQATGEIVPFDADCNRFENGILTTNNSAITPPPGSKVDLDALGCKAQFDTKLYSYIKQVKPRRTLIVDTDLGLVFAIVVFVHPGTVTTVDVPHVGPVRLKDTALRPFNDLIGELFKIKNGRILEVEAEMTNLPYGASDGWSH